MESSGGEVLIALNSSFSGKVAMKVHEISAFFVLEGAKDNYSNQWGVWSLCSQPVKYDDWNQYGDP